eukprot:3329903-Pyramimonas_sp.AAC.1
MVGHYLDRRICRVPGLGYDRSEGPTCAGILAGGADRPKAVLQGGPTQQTNRPRRPGDGRGARRRSADQLSQRCWPRAPRVARALRRP